VSVSVTVSVTLTKNLLVSVTVVLLSLYGYKQHTHKVLSKSAHYLSYPADKPTNKQTDKRGINIIRVKQSSRKINPEQSNT